MKRLIAYLSAPRVKRSFRKAYELAFFSCIGCFPVGTILRAFDGTDNDRNRLHLRKLQSFCYFSLFQTFLPSFSTRSRDRPFAKKQIAVCINVPINPRCIRRAFIGRRSRSRQIPTTGTRGRAREKPLPKRHQKLCNVPAKLEAVPLENRQSRPYFAGARA